jgi:signal transduction histidine kinase
VVTAPDLPLHVHADAGKLRQAILNVLVNAYKFSPSGGPVTLDISALDDGPAGRKVALHIQDTGIGMTPEQADKACTRFYRSDTSGQVSGAGLGMSIVKEIVELHQGSLVIESTLGTGTRIGILLPQDQQEPG